MDTMLLIGLGALFLGGLGVLRVGWKCCAASKHRKDDQDNGTGLY